MPAESLTSRLRSFLTNRSIPPAIRRRHRSKVFTTESLEERTLLSGYGPEQLQNLWAEDGAPGSTPRGFAEVNGQTFFAATTPQTGYELFVTDGTTEGTRMVRDIRTGTQGGFPQEITAFEGYVYFTVDRGFGRELWYSDGTEFGTRSSMFNGIRATVSDLNVAGGRLYFRAEHNTFGRELWYIDNPRQSPQLVGDIRPGSLSTNFEAFHVFNNQLYFAANGGDLFHANGNTYTIYDTVSLTRVYDIIDYDGALYIDAEGLGGKGLWKSDGQSQVMTTLVRDIRGNFNSHTNLGGLRVAPNNNGIMFSASTPATGSEPWFSDGTAAGTYVIDIRAGNLGSNAFISGPEADLNGYTYFYAETAEAGGEIWRSDGTIAGTIQMADTRPGVLGGMTGRAGRIGDRVIFNGAQFGSDAGIWVTDGTQAGTVPMLTSGGGYLEEFFTTSSGTVLFQGWLDGVGRELLTSDGTAAGTQAVKDIARNINSSNPQNLTEHDGHLFFSAADHDGRELWATDGSVPAKVLDINPSGDSNPLDFISAFGAIFFTANDGSSGCELWMSDGTEGGTARVADIEAGSSGSFPYELTYAGGQLFFGAETSTNGYELFVTDGTDAGTVLVKDIEPGSDSSSPYGLTALDSSVLFVAETETNGSELWASDGTGAGTIPLTDLPADDEVYDTFGVFKDNFYFSVYSESNGQVTLWRSDGTVDGTEMYLDVEVSSQSSFIPLGETLLFAANDQLWATDGSGEEPIKLADRDFGRSVVKDGIAYLASSNDDGRGIIVRTDGTPGGTSDLFQLPYNGFAQDMQVVGEEIVYSARGSFSGHEVWAFDGNRSSLREITSIRQQNANINEVGSLGTSVFYSSNDYENDSGVELWQLDFAEGPGIRVTESSGNTIVDSMQGSDDIWVSLDVAPASDVVLELETEFGVVLSHYQLTFTADNWSDPQRVRVQGPSTQFLDDEGDATAQVTISVLDGVSDDAYEEVPSKLVPATITTIPATRFDSSFTPVDTARTIAVLENDTPATQLVVASVETPDDGTATINPDGTVTYTPNPGFTGSDSFDYEVSLAPTKLSPTDTEMARVGESIDVSGDYAVVGASLEDTDGKNAGAAYVLKRQGSEWIRVARLTGSTTTAGDRFGAAVAIDGERIVVSAPSANEAGVRDTGEVFVFERNNAGDWVEVARLLDPLPKIRDLFGTDVAVDGDRIAVGARLDDGRGTNSGSVFVFERDPADGSWTPSNRIKASDSSAFLQFGISVSLKRDRLVVGAYKDDAGATDSGAGYVFDRQEDGTWVEAAKVKDPQPQDGQWFGYDVALDAGTLVVGSHLQDRNGKQDTGAAHVFQLGEEGWEFRQTLGELRTNGSFGGGPKDYFGYSVDVDEGKILIGSPLDDGGGRNSGSAYVFERGDGGWVPHESLGKIKATDSANYDEFGRSVAIGNADGDFFTLVGAVRDDDSADNAGAVYANYSRVASATVSVSVGDTLLAASAPNQCVTHSALASADIEAATNAAIDAWSIAGASASQLAAMRQATFHVYDLPGLTLGMATSDVVVLDTDAAGFGWSTDVGQPASESRIDLVTVIAHELGHVVGLADESTSDTIMSETLGDGERRMPEATDLEPLDLMFAAGGDGFAI